MKALSPIADVALRVIRLRRAMRGECVRTWTIVSEALLYWAIRIEGVELHKLEGCLNEARQELTPGQVAEVWPGPGPLNFVVKRRGDDIFIGLRGSSAS